MACIQHRIVRDVVSLDSSATCADAVRLMAARGIGSVGVRRSGKLVGLVTERDLISAMAEGRGGDTLLGEAMRPDFPSVPSRATEAECAQLMRARRTRHLAVTEGGEVVGLISMLDLVDLVVEDAQWSIDQLESYIRGGRAQQLSEPLRTVFHHARAAVS